MRTKKIHSFKKKIFAQRCLRFREKLGLTQEDFAKEIHRTRSAYVVIEAGTVSPSIHVLADIYAFLNKKGIAVSMDYLFGLTDLQSESEVSKEWIKKYNDLKKDYDKLTEIYGLQKQLLGK